MPSTSNDQPVGVLLSGGLDSAILVGDLLARGQRVQPFYVRFGLHWEPAELAAARRFLAAVGQPGLAPLVVLDLPLADLYGGHWSLTGQSIPDANSADDAVFLPGRNALLLVKTALYCQMHDIGRLAMAPLTTSPFADAKPEFVQALMMALNAGARSPVRIELPFAGLTKRQVMELGRRLPLVETFSCLNPQDGRHCGRCNKCAERRLAFALVESTDPTSYATDD